MYANVSFRAGSSEFPHDNPAFDECAVWIGTALCALEWEAEEADPEPEGDLGVHAGALTDDTTDAPSALPSEPTTAQGTEVAVETTAGTTLDAAPIPVPVPEPAEPREMPETDAFTTFVRAVSDVAGSHGGADAAAHTRYLLVSGCPAPCPLDPEAEHALVAGNILRADAEGPGAAEGFWELASAWQRVLRGEDQDLSRCGESTLDNWAADLVARVVANPGKVSSIRRDLRRRGVAAFGLLEAAH